MICSRCAIRTFSTGSENAFVEPAGSRRRATTLLPSPEGADHNTTTKDWGLRFFKASVSKNRIRQVRIAELTRRATAAQAAISVAKDSKTVVMVGILLMVVPTA